MNRTLMTVLALASCTAPALAKADVPFELTVTPIFGFGGPGEGGADGEASDGSELAYPHLGGRVRLGTPGVFETAPTWLTLDAGIEAASERPFVKDPGDDPTAWHVLVDAGARVHAPWRFAPFVGARLGVSAGEAVYDSRSVPFVGLSTKAEAGLLVRAGDTWSVAVGAEAWLLPLTSQTSMGLGVGGFAGVVWQL